VIQFLTLPETANNCNCFVACFYQTPNNLPQAVRWLVVYVIVYPVTFCSLMTTKFLVLRRYLYFARPKAVGVTVAHRWNQVDKVMRALVAVFAAGIVAGFCGNIAAAMSLIQAAGSFDSASSVKNVSLARYEAAEALASSARAASVFFGFEAVFLPLIVMAVSIVGFFSIRRIYSTVGTAQQSMKLISPETHAIQHKESVNEVVSTGRRLRRHIFITSGFVFVSFLLRAVFTTMGAIASALADATSQSPDEMSINRCDTRFNVSSHVLMYLIYSPELFYGIALISQPITLLVVLWGMTSGHALEIMKSKHQDRVGQGVSP
jgi:hypothetical protein